MLEYIILIGWKILVKWQTFFSSYDQFFSRWGLRSNQMSSILHRLVQSTEGIKKKITSPQDQPQANILIVVNSSCYHLIQLDFFADFFTMIIHKKCKLFWIVLFCIVKGWKLLISFLLCLFLYSNFITPWWSLGEYSYTSSSCWWLMPARG